MHVFLLSVQVEFLFFFFNDTATTEIYTLSLHDALPISWRGGRHQPSAGQVGPSGAARWGRDRKSTRLNSSHTVISYAVFCLKKKKKMYAVVLKLRRLQVRSTIELSAKIRSAGSLVVLLS